MRSELWQQLPRQRTILKAFLDGVSELATILEFNGPQILSFKSEAGSWLAVAADDDDEHVRWLVAPVSEYELQAYLRGGTTTWNCLNKPTVRIVDLDYSTNFSEAELFAEVPFDSIPEEFLPESDSFLPDEILDLTESQAPTLIIEGDSLAEPSFQMFGEVLLNIQKLWDALGQFSMSKPTFRGQVQAEIRQRTELQLANIGSGSLKVTVKPSDKKAFDEVASEYKKLVTLNPHDPSFYKLPTRVRSTYHNYSRSLGRFNISMVTEWGSNVAFISSASARYVSQAIRKELEWEFDEEIVDDGFFVGFDLESGRFVFRSESWPENIEGKILPDIIESVRKGSLTISLASPNRYYVGLVVLTRGQESRYLLTSVKPLNRP